MVIGLGVLSSVRAWTGLCPALYVQPSCSTSAAAVLAPWRCCFALLCRLLHAVPLACIALLRVAATAALLQHLRQELDEPLR
jgi:hypothetical protein